MNDIIKEIVIWMSRSPFNHAIVGSVFIYPFAYIYHIFGFGTLGKCLFLAWSTITLMYYLKEQGTSRYMIKGLSVLASLNPMNWEKKDLKQTIIMTAILFGIALSHNILF